MGHTWQSHHAGQYPNQHMGDPWQSHHAGNTLINIWVIHGSHIMQAIP